MKTTSRFLRKYQSGVTLLELVAVVIISALAVTGSLYINSQVSTYKNIDAAANAIGKVGVAVDNYAAKYAYELREGTLPIPGVADPYHPTLSELVALGMFGTGLNPAALPGGDMATQIERVPAGCPTETCNIAWLTYAVKPFVRSATGTADEAAAGRVVKTLGAFAGASPVENPGIFKGYNDSWGSTVVNPTGQAGVVALRGGYGTNVMAKFLRVDGGNEMTGDFHGGGHDITGVQNITADGDATINGRGKVKSLNVSRFVSPTDDPSQLAMAGTPCADGNGAMRADAGGNILSCQSGVWKSSSGSVKFAISGDQCSGYIFGPPGELINLIADDASGCNANGGCNVWKNINSSGYLAYGASPNGSGGHVWVYHQGNLVAYYPTATNCSPW